MEVCCRTQHENEVQLAQKLQGSAKSKADKNVLCQWNENHQNIFRPEFKKLVLYFEKFSFNYGLLGQ